MIGECSRCKVPEVGRSHGVLVPPPHPHSRNSCAGCNLQTQLPWCNRYMMIDSLFSCYLAPQLYFIPINHCFLLETLSSLSSNDPTLHSFSFYLCWFFLLSGLPWWCIPRFSLQTSSSFCSHTPLGLFSGLKALNLGIVMMSLLLSPAVTSA